MNKEYFVSTARNLILEYEKYNDAVLGILKDNHLVINAGGCKFGEGIESPITEAAIKKFTERADYLKSELLSTFDISVDGVSVTKSVESYSKILSEICNLNQFIRECEFKITEVELGKFKFNLTDKYSDTNGSTVFNCDVLNKCSKVIVEDLESKLLSLKASLNTYKITLKEKTNNGN